MLPVPATADAEDVALTAPSSQALEDCERVLASFAPSTQATYRRAVERFATWTHRRGVSSWKQITDRVLADYVEHLRDVRRLGHASATVETSAVRTVARAMGCPSWTAHWQGPHSRACGRAPRYRSAGAGRRWLFVGRRRTPQSAWQRRKGQ